MISLIKYSKRSGFTLIELLLVIVLLGIITVVSVPNFHQTYSRLKLKQTTDQISYLMRYMQTRAINRNLEHRLEFDEPRRHYWFTQEEVEGSEEENQEKNFQRIAGRWGRAFAVPEDIRVETTQVVISFLPDGKIDKARIYICERTDCWTVSTQEQRGYVDIFDYRLEDREKM